jgi:hypothetical protein
MRLVVITMAFLLTVFVERVHSAELPVDVRAFMEIRAACDHWRGEYGEGDSVRQYEINKNTCELCQGTDAALASLRQKYRGNRSVIDALKPLQEKVEDPSPQAMKQACRNALSNPPKSAAIGSTSAK